MRDIATVRSGTSELALFTYKGTTLALLPIPSKETQASKTVALTTTDNQKFDITFSIKRRTEPVVVLPVPKKLNTTPQKLVESLGEQKAKISQTLVQGSKDILFSKPFGLPLADNRRITSPFSEIRKTGNESIRHVGIDFGAKTGALVYAINAGVVLDAYTDPVYGKTIILDHGATISSLYMHLNSIFVSKGDSVERGKIIGTVGQTGLASAPHLHLSIKINSQSTDPLSFIRNLK